MKRVLLAILILLAGCGGSPADFEHATQCAPQVYIARDAQGMTCEHALNAYRMAQEITGVDASGARIIFVPTVSKPDAWGTTYPNGDIEIQENVPRTLVHELYHLWNANHHNGWAKDGKIAVFEANLVAGGFTDEASHLECHSTTLGYDGSGFMIGGSYVCVPSN